MIMAFLRGKEILSWIWEALNLALSQAITTLRSSVKHHKLSFNHFSLLQVSYGMHISPEAQDDASLMELIKEKDF